MQAIEVAASRDGETLKHSFAHTSPKMVTIILCFKSKSRRKKRTVERPARETGRKKGKNNWNKVNQNQITSEFHGLNHSKFVAFCVRDLEFLLLWGLVCVKLTSNGVRCSQGTRPVIEERQRFELFFIQLQTITTNQPSITDQPTSE